MDAKPDGGSAFPVFFPPANGCGPYAEAGMTLRDYFAAHAPDCPKAIWNNRIEAGFTAMQATVLWRGQYADAMIAERAK